MKSDPNTKIDLLQIEMDARRLRAEAMRNAFVHLAAWLRRALSHSAPKAGHQAA